MKQFADWVTRRAYRAGLVAAALALVPPLGIVGSGVLVLTSLRRGTGLGWAAAAMATLVLLLVAVAGGADPLSAVFAGLVFWAPAVGMAEVLRKSGSLDLCVQIAVIVGLLLTAMWLTAAGGAWTKTLADEVRPLLEGSGFEPEAIAAVLILVPGVMAMSLVLAALSGLFLGMYWQAALTSPGALGTAFRRLRVGRLLAAIGLVVLVGGLVTGHAAFANLLLILATGFMLQGLAIVHGLAARRQWPPGALILLYMLLVFGMSLMAPLLAVFGLVDNWLDLRSRFPGRA